MFDQKYFGLPLWVWIVVIAVIFALNIQSILPDGSNVSVLSQTATPTCDYVPVTYNPADFDNVLDGETFTQTLVLEGVDWNNTLVTNCSFKDIEGDGILLRNVENVVISGCTFEGIQGQGAIRGSVTGGTNNIVIANNVISDVAENGINFGQRVGSDIDHKGLIIEGNIITNTGMTQSNGLHHSVYVQTQDVIVRHNIIAGIRDGNGISVRSSGEVSCNTVTGNSKADKAGIRYYSDHQTGPSKTLVLTDNTVSGQDIGIDLFAPVDRYDGKTGVDHVVKTFVVTNNELSRNYQPFRLATIYQAAPFIVVLE